MDVKVFHYLIDALKVAGCSIYEDNIPVLYNSLIKLQSENHFNSVYLWGRIETLSNDYYIAYGHQKDPIENRIFFYTQNLLEWDIMPTDWSILETDLVRRIKTKLYGNPRYLETIDNSNKKSQETTEYPIAPSVVMKYDDYVESGEEDVQNIENITFNDVISINEADEIMETESFDYPSNLKSSIKEEDRLAITVQMIDNECHIVPRGYFYKLPNGNIIKAPYFKGLDYSEIGNEQNFLHINPQYCRPKGPTNDVRPDYNGSIDFLESIDKDIPKGCWTSRILSNRYFIIHSLLWPGAVFFQDMNTGIHGYFYNGYGLKNLDLPFMI
ncbi:hypothetical protein AGLY_015538 [Aphis glycines]|uniref:Radial spoke head protein 9 homolog n=1 Tax=Aphis glycines TaxID=307491 RepID=A0A6G0T2C6_APHGL|nr:hypothetical protein AGLY_015538 [Aphis glycines]